MKPSNNPVELELSPPEYPRNRLTVMFRPILAIPHVVLVGGPILGLLGAGYRTGVFGLLALAIAFLDWAAILVTGQPLAGLQALKLSYLSWRARVLVYCALLRDEYPPFGETPYPALLRLPDPPSRRDRWSVGLRPLLVLPHLLVLAVLMLLWLVVAVYSWFTILATGGHPANAWQFGKEVIRYSLRVEAYLLLIHDQFPPFSLSDEPAPAPSPLTEGEAMPAGRAPARQDA
jgi:hypothetical protein